MSEYDDMEQLEAIWKVSNIKGYPCPLFGKHSRAYIFPNKDIWMYHMTVEHKPEDYVPFIDVKTSFNEYVALYDQAIKSMETVEETVKEVETDVETNDGNETES